MAEVNLAHAKAHLSELVNKAAAGETVNILKRGKRVAKLTAISANKRPIDLQMLRKLTSGMSPQEQSAGEFMRSVRDETRY